MTRWVCVLLIGGIVLGDGMVVPPRDYEGSLEERAQEAIIVFLEEGQEDLILKITVHGAAAGFAWIVPFPNEPTVHKADKKIFRELFDYVQARRVRTRKGKNLGGGSEPKAAADGGVKVLSRRVVGSFDVAVVRETEAGALNGWLEKNGYKSLEGAEDVLGFYREKGYVYACIKVADAALKKSEPADIHPLRFRFKTGGRDGIYFPMKLTGLQAEPFDVNLYVFHRYWLNDRLSKYGFVERGFSLRHRDLDTAKCKANGGKDWSAPKSDPYLRGTGHLFPTVTTFMKEHYAGQRFYLTNISGRFAPKEVRKWKDDLWLFPYYTNRDFVPHDARAGGPASLWYR